MTTILDLLSEYEERATPGPWREGINHFNVPLLCIHAPDARMVMEMGSLEGLPAEENAALIALLRNHAADLLAVARAAREHYEESASINASEYLPLPIQAIGSALAPLLADAPEDGA